MTLFKPGSPDEAYRHLARALDVSRHPNERLAAAHQLQLSLYDLFPELVHEARMHGASWQTIAAIVNLDVDEVAVSYQRAVVQEAQHRPGWDAAQAWAVVQQVGE